MSIKGLSHVGLYVKDLPRMAAFYQEVLGLRASHELPDRAVFLTSDEEREDHEVVLFKGRDGDSRIVQQVSFRVENVEDVLIYYRRFKDKGVTIDSQVSHGSGVSCYFLDPEGNRLEVFADVDTAGQHGYSGPLDLERPAAELIAKVQSGPEPAMTGRRA